MMFDSHFDANATKPIYNIDPGSYLGKRGEESVQNRIMEAN